MTRLPRVITIRLDEATLAKITERVGPSGRLRSVSHFARKAIERLLPQVEPVIGWSLRRITRPSPGCRS